MTVRRGLVAFGVLLNVLCAAGAVAAPISIVSETGPTSASLLVGADLTSTTSATEDLASSWTQSVAFNDVTISVLLGNTGTFDGSAYLTTAILPGTTTVDQVASVNFAYSYDPSNPGGSDWLTLFTGIDLSAGTYYLTLASPGRGTFGWTAASPLTITTAAGVTDNSDYFAYGNAVDTAYAPASELANEHLGLEYQVSGVPVPEPATGLLLAAALLACGAYRRTNTRPSDQSSST